MAGCPCLDLCSLPFFQAVLTLLQVVGISLGSPGCLHKRARIGPLLEIILLTILILYSITYHDQRAPKITWTLAGRHWPLVWLSSASEAFISCPLSLLCVSVLEAGASILHLAWSCSFLCKTLHFTPWVWPLRLVVFLVACSTVGCNSRIETSRNARGFQNPILDRMTVFWNWRGNCNSNNSEIQHQTPVLLTSGKSPNPKRFAFQTNLKTTGALQEWQNWPDSPHFCGTKPRCSRAVSSTFAISESIHF